MHLQVLLYRLRWFHAPAAVLMMLLQRTPVLRLVTGGTVSNVGLQSGDVLKSVFALAALGAYNSVAGATTFNATVVSPTTVTPASGAANSTFSASGAANAAFSLSFNVSGAPGTSKSWKVLGTLPAGLSVTGGTAISGGFLFNGITKVTLAGTPTTAGSQSLTFTAYDTSGGSGNNAHVTCTINITSVSSAPVFTTQPGSQTVAAGSNVTFTSVATGTPTPTFQWYKDNVALSGQTGTSLSLTNVQAANTGSYTVTATNSAAPSGISSNAATLTLSQAITFGALSGKTFGDAPFTVSATASSSLSPTFSIVSGPATISGSTVTITGGGTVVVRASQAGNTSYAAATPVDQSFSVAQAAQTITFAALSAKTYGNTPFTVSATASSGLTPTFSIFSGPATISGSTVTITGAGTVVVRASQAGNANYAAATAVDQSFSVAQGAQTITFGALSGKTFGNAPFTVSATASSGLTPTFTIVSGPATISGSTVTITGTGTVVVRASQPGDSNYTAATAVDQSFSVAQAAQTITFGALSGKSYGDVPFTVSASASSSLTPTFSIVSGPATISGGTVTITGVGTVVVRASQPGDANYSAATPVDQSFSVSKATATVTLGGLSQSYTGAALSATASTTPGSLTVTFTYDGSPTAPTNAGSYAVVGTINDSLYQGSANGTLVISQSAQTITFGALSDKNFGDAPFTVSATASSGLTPTFVIVSGPATISGGTVTLTGGGTVVVRASQAGNANYAAATPVDQSFSVTAAPAFTTQPSSQTTVVGSTVTFTVVATGTPTPTLLWYKDNVALSGQTGATLSLTNVQSGDAGSYTVTATNSAAPAGVSSTAATLTVNAAPVVPAFTTQPSSQTVSSGANVTFTVVATGVPAPTLLWYKDNVALSGQTGSTLSLTNVQPANAGSYTVKATNSAAPSGVSSTAATLTVNTAPAFTTQPSSQTVSTAANVTFTVVATGTPTPTLQWYKDSVALPGKTGATLSLTNVQTGDAGSYTVTATNSEAPSGVTSNAATLTVNPVPSVPKILVHPVASTTAMIGDTVILSVQATGFPSPSYQWKKKVNLPGKTGPTLTLPNVQIADAGIYSVLVTNSGLPKGVTSQNSVLTVRVPPPAVLTSGVLHVGDPVSWDLTGGSPYPAGVTFFAAKFPGGLVLNAATGQISGTISGKVATYKMTYWTQSGKTRSTVRSLSVVVAAAAVKSAKSVNPPASANAATPIKAAKYAALLDATSPSAPLPVGKVEINVATGGAFTGRLVTGDPAVYVLRGRLQRGGALDPAIATVTVVRTKSLNAPDYLLALSVSDAGVISVSLATADGTVGEGDGAQLAATASADVYTMVMRHPVNLGDLPDYPRGDGTFKATITSGGVLVISGKTPDGVSLTATASLGVDHVFRLYAKPYGPSAGYLAGSLLLTARADNPSLFHITAANGSDLYLSRPAKPGAASYPNGFGPIGLEATMEPVGAPPLPAP